MANNAQDLPLNETSPSVQTHLGILQSTIQRMANNSSSSKTWCITVVSAILVVVADKEEPNFAFIALIPTLLFLALDTYYLSLEKAFRESYNSFIHRLHQGELQPSDLYSVSPKGKMSKHQLEALKSFSIWGFYLTLVVLIILTRSLVG
jgi:hypothetical protein